MGIGIEVDRPNGSTRSIGQRSPHWMLTFVRYQSRSPLKQKSSNPTALEKPLVVISDCLSLQITEKKEGYSSVMVAVLKGGDVNYVAAVGTGDFVLANIVNSPDVINKEGGLYERALAGRGINRYDDGFKGVFKVHSVRRRVQIGPDGAKIVTYIIIAYSHMELNNTIYFIPQLVSPGDKQGGFNFYFNINKNYQTYLASIGETQEISKFMAFIFDTFLGTGLSVNSNGTQVSPLNYYYIPDLLSGLLSLKGNRSINITNILVGPQKYSANASGRNLYRQILNPSNLKKPTSVSSSIQTQSRVWFTDEELKGRQKPTVDQFNSVKLGDLIRNKIHDVLNEMYVCHRVDPESNIILPSIVIREKPFTSDNGPGATKFSNLPFWDIASDIIYEVDLGKDDAGRINFVQLYGQNTSVDSQVTIAEQIARQNYVSDDGDIQLHGLKPYVTTSNFDYYTSLTPNISQTTEWVKILADWVIGSHLKLNGTIGVAGIFEPIAPGDNVKIDNFILHVESVTHTCQQGMNGEKTFRTSLSLSHGVEITSSGVTYPELSKADRDARMYSAKNLNMPVPSHEDYQGERSKKRVNRVVKRTNDIIDSDSPEVNPNTIVNTGTPPPTTKKRKQIIQKRNKRGQR